MPRGQGGQKQQVIDHMKKPDRFVGKSSAISKGKQNQSLPAQLNKQLKKHYVNKYGVGAKSSKR
jgi:hypothetical protein